MAESIIRVLLTGDAKGLSRAAQESSKELERTGKAAGTSGGSIKAGLAIGGGAALVVAEQAMKMGDAFELAHARASTALKNTGSDTSQLDATINTLTNSSISLADTTKTDVAGAYATLLTGLGSNKAAMGAWTGVVNLAAAKGLSLGDASLAVTKMMEGNTRVAKAYAIQLPFASASASKLSSEQVALYFASLNLKTVQQQIADGQIPHSKAAAAYATAVAGVDKAQGNLSITTAELGKNQDVIAAKFKGSYAAAADTAAGHTAKMKNEAHNLEITLGVGLNSALIHSLSYLDKWTSGVANGTNSVGKLTDALAKLDTKLGSALGSALSDVGNVLGLGGASGQGSAGAAARDRARLDAINRAKQTGTATHRAGGGPVQAGNRYEVNELGQEFFTPGASGWVTPAGRGGGGSTTPVIVHVHSADPAAVVRAIQTQARRNGVAF